MGSAQLSEDYIPTGTFSFITYVNATATKVMQVNISTTGLLQVGYTNDAISAGTSIRMSFGYDTAL